jgi:hypothetical protein
MAILEYRMACKVKLKGYRQDISSPAELFSRTSPHVEQIAVNTVVKQLGESLFVATYPDSRVVPGIGYTPMDAVISLTKGLKPKEAVAIPVIAAKHPHKPINACIYDDKKWKRRDRNAVGIVYYESQIFSSSSNAATTASAS